MFNNALRKALVFRNPILSRSRTKRAQQLIEKVEKCSPDIIRYLESSPEYKDFKDRIPKHLLRKYKSPESMYLINKATAQEIAKILKSHITTSRGPVVEVNPGFGFLTEALLEYHDRIHMYEMSNSFSEFVSELEIKYPHRFSYKVADFFGMWKLAFQDKMDNGHRMAELLGDLATDDTERPTKIVGAMPGMAFVKHILNTIIFHNTTHHLGRPELYMVIPGDKYEYLTDDDAPNQKQRTLPTLFQIFLNHKVLSKVPRLHYLPHFTSEDSKKQNVFTENYLYLVKITQKEKLPCSPEYLPLMWYFFRPQVISKTTRVIPFLEQWIPGCGVWLITGQDPPDTNPALVPSDDDESLPHMNIFTEFGDLTLQQKITVFKRFISWPEFEQCPFRVTMESNLPKYFMALDSDKKSVVVDDDEDLNPEIHRE